MALINQPSGLTLEIGKSAGKKYATRFLGIVTKQLTDELFKLTDGELKAVIKRCKSLTNTNCYWREYYMKDVVLYFAQDHLEWKKDRRRELKGKSKSK